MAIATITLMVSMCQLRSVLISDKVGLNGNETTSELRNES